LALSRSPEIRCAWLARLLVEDEEAKKFTEIKDYSLEMFPIT